MVESIQSVLQDKSILNAVVYCAGSVIGQVIFWITRWANNEKWVMVNFKRTVAAVTSNFGVMAGLVVLVPLDTISLGLALFTGITQGIALDSMVNKGTRKVLTEEERKELK